MDVLISGRVHVDRFFLNRFLGGSIQARGFHTWSLSTECCLYFGLAVGFGRSFAGRSYNFDRFQVRSRFGSSWNWFGTESS